MRSAFYNGLVMPTILILCGVALVAIMGYALQRGATCTVAAIDEILSNGRASRLLALLEASLWVLGGVLIGNALGLMPPMPAGYAITMWTVLGAAVLGLGAAVNGACVFGAVAQFGSGNWVYLATPVGFFIGSALGQASSAQMLPQKLADSSWAFQTSPWLAFVVALVMLWRLLTSLWQIRPDAQSRTQALISQVWQPHAATQVIAITFLFMLWLFGAWAYTDVLAEWARGQFANTGVRGLLLVALWAGAALGGWTAGRFRSQRADVKGVSRCLLGGALMGAGSELIPGSNDGLILTGIPLLWPHAWLAFAVMCATIAIYLKAVATRTT